MPKITITGIPGADGSYELDAGYFTNRELHTIKEISGVRAGELETALAAGDNDLVVAVTLIALQRAGNTVDPDLIWEATAGCITFEASVAETAAERAAVDEIPPASTPPSEQPGGENNANETEDSTGLSGPDSGSDGATNLSVLRATGTQG